MRNFLALRNSTFGIGQSIHAGSLSRCNLMGHSEVDTSFFVLTVDLWSADGTKEVNLVRHSATSPSISAATAASYPPRPLSPPYGNTNSTTSPAHSNWAPQHQMLQQHPHPQHPNGQQYGYTQPPTMFPNYRTPQPLPPPSQSQYPSSQQQYAPQQYNHQQQYSTQQQPQGYYTNNPPTPVGYYPPQFNPNQGPLLPPDQVAPQSGSGQPSGMFTRNLIGSLSVSAFKLTDTNSELGIWFILQDLSVRTEGLFRYGTPPYLLSRPNSHDAFTQNPPCTRLRANRLFETLRKP